MRVSLYISTVCLALAITFPAFAFQTGTPGDRLQPAGLSDSETESGPVWNWLGHERGWFWYETVPLAKKEKKEPEPKVLLPQKRQKPVSYTEMLKQIRQALAEIRARAVLFPTSGNVAAWYQAQLIISRMAGDFTQTAILIPVLYPELDTAPQLGGKSQLGKLTVSYMKRKEKEKAFKKIVSASVLVLVYRSAGCYLCKREAEEVIKAAKNSHFKTYALYEDEPPSGMDRARPLTQEIRKTLNVKALPALYLYHDGHFYYLGAGFLGQEDIRNRVFLVAEKHKWLNLKPLYMVENKRYKPREVIRILEGLAHKGYAPGANAQEAALPVL